MEDKQHEHAGHSAHSSQPMPASRHPFLAVLIRRPVLCLMAVGIPIFLINFFAGHPGISGWDALYYYSYAGAIADSGTLNLENAYVELVARGADPEKFTTSKRTATGRVYNYFTIGHPLLHTPATFVGSLVSGLLERRSGAYGVTAQLFYCLSCIATACIGLWLLTRLLSGFFDRECAAVAVYVMVSCSMMGYYVFVLPALSHTTSIFLAGVIVTIFMYILERPRCSPLMFLLLGLSIGYTAMVRLQDVGFAICLPIVAVSLARHSMGGGKKTLRIAMTGLGILAGFFPQMLHWKWREGAWLVTQYSDYATFDWLKPHVFGILFSSKGGLFFWHPALLFAFAGFLLYMFGARTSRTVKTFCLMLLLVFFAIFYIGASFSIWWFGDSFGSRPFLSITPLFMIGIAALWKTARTTLTGRTLFWSVAGVLAALNSALAVCYHLGIISRH